jgi:3-deoxy-D-manno-octulosonate 8-phosphate phosphatase (KDO 8-P phosphatase)
VEVAVISGRQSPAVQRRCEELGIRHVLLGAGDKAAALSGLLSALQLQRTQCICVGDDEPDVPMLRLAGLAVAVADAHPTAAAVAHRRTRHRGGDGAVREVCDWLLAACRRGASTRR